MITNYLIFVEWLNWWIKGYQWRSHLRHKMLHRRQRGCNDYCTPSNTSLQTLTWNITISSFSPPVSVDEKVEICKIFDLKNSSYPPLKMSCLTLFTQIYQSHFTVLKYFKNYHQHSLNKFCHKPNLLSHCPWHISTKIANYQIFLGTVVFYTWVSILLNVIQSQSPSLGNPTLAHVP